MIENAPHTALCLDCNYSLHGLMTDRCPECGRAFDPGDASSFNAGRRLTWLDRNLLAPLGVPTLMSAMVAPLLLLYMSLGTDIYYMFAHIIFSILVCGIVAVILGIRVGLRRFIPPPNVPRPSDGHRFARAGLLTILACGLVFLQVPLRVTFLMARPELDRMVADIHSGKLTLPIANRRAGPLVVSTSSSYGGDDTLFFTYNIAGASGGLAYCPTKGPKGYYNDGTDGALGGYWHWWADD
jgi:hypothetical protein